MKNLIDISIFISLALAGWAIVVYTDVISTRDGCFALGWALRHGYKILREE